MPLVFISGAIANKAGQGGEAWVRLSWVRGLLKLGCQVYFVEQIEPADCVDADGRQVPWEQSLAFAYFRKVADDFGLDGRAALLVHGGAESWGISLNALKQLAADADLLINISGHLRLKDLRERFRQKAYIDIDPGFTQLWHADPATPFQLGEHDYYFTIGENIGFPPCTIPTGGIHWRTTRQPVVLDDWPVVSANAQQRFTTIANWRGPFGPVVYDGHTYGLKVHEFRKFAELPRLAPYSFELALNIDRTDEKDRQMLVDQGWLLTDPQQAAADPAVFRRYIQESSAEFSVAQGVYVQTNSGWFSDRSVRYLASGKPVLVQDTGLEGHLPLGHGLHIFRTLEEAVDGASRIVGHYEEECVAARSVAQKCFDSNVVLSRLLEEIGIAPYG